MRRISAGESEKKATSDADIIADTKISTTNAAAQKITLGSKPLYTTNCSID
jgi:hypothetical protein